MLIKQHLIMQQKSMQITGTRIRQLQEVVFDIHIEANKDSTLWKGTADIYMFANWSEGGEQ
jgi:hypothetical protein